ncbi:DUF3071 domain-containing protein [Mycetocola tolaasinivorans]|uniref:DUF3071 domain-containing protein n=1 Tax=Mycetocola tolaasinivorans TaxID=76635 RepID=A0A3L7ABB6_9MICO|nr:septation protein SepH [Mycetocola tolaasinivorans]RLP76961.1 DUF3071 domain-containing protein [Mycetocola tolaasinivorans]
MQDLKVVGIEDGVLIAATENGDRYRLEIDEELQSQLRRMKAPLAATPKIRPREVQAHIRAGLSAEEIAELTGADAEYVRRFEGPILAEREHMVAAALSVPVVAASVPGTEEGEANFGTAIRARLESLEAEGERWTSWKDAEEGWIVKLSFTAQRVEHDARWSFDPKRHVLSPHNSEAVTLSKQGDIAAPLIPRLRAVEPSADPSEARFSTDAFETGVIAPAAPQTSPETAPESSLPTLSRRNEPAHAVESSRRGVNAAADAAINRAEDRGDEGNQHTADLLQALRKRRGERENRAERESRLEQDQRRVEPAEDADTGFGLRPVDVPLENFETLTGEVPVQDSPEAHLSPVRPVADPEDTRAFTPAETESAHADNSTGAIRNRRGRKAMPSWDEIVFGARTEED